MASFKYLRKLTPKSKLGFGKFSDLTIGELLILRKTVYLRWVYYNCSMIDYDDVIFSSIHMNEKHKIEKPGVNPDLYEIVNNKIQATISGGAVNFYKMKSKMNRKNRIKHFRASCGSRNTASKGVMQAFNHGKMR